jgi:hypothetical protein
MKKHRQMGFMLIFSGIFAVVTMSLLVVTLTNTNIKVDVLFIPLLFAFIVGMFGFLIARKISH